ncbi:hypothetical protein Goarm_014165 [Gossypium armourianum]|uniref:Uncharacterized protein n=1 Tax=Gossypium armourianum TaxID=34283 RepID=A0A7J9J6A6_9ROSI|nr:hypothetical protein [Gossypium armourianum]
MKGNLLTSRAKGRKKRKLMVLMKLFLNSSSKITLRK